MKNININLGLLTRIFKQHTSVLLWVFLLIVILLEFTVVKGAVDMVRRVRNTAPNVQTQIVRVNISQYNAIEKLLEENLSFDPSVTTNDSPFGTPPRTLIQ